MTTMTVTHDMAYTACKIHRLTRDEPSPGEIARMQVKLQWFTNSHLAKGAQEWQPIETAPKDGTRFIGCRNGEIDFYHWQDGLNGDRPEGWRDSFIFVYSKDGLSHWMPLPAAPMLSQRGEMESG